MSDSTQKKTNKVYDFPTPRERSGISIQEDFDMLLDSLFNAALAVKHSENVLDEDRESELATLTTMFTKYLRLREQLNGQ